MLNWLDWGYDQNLHQHSTAQSCDLLEAEAGNGTAEYTLALLYGRIVVDEAEVQDLFPFAERSFLIWQRQSHL